MKRKLRSNFKKAILGVIAQKHAFGYPYVESARILGCFDQFCFEHFTAENVLTREIGLRWAEKKTTENGMTLRNRVMVIRELAKYMNGLGGQAFIIPIELARKSPKYVPHIYTRDELSVFFSAADRFEYHAKSPARHLVIPVIFRVIYCCGLRPFEARKLRIQDVCLKTGAIKIVESKGHKDRVVVLADDVLALCRNYRRQVERVFPSCEYFFPNLDGYGIKKRWLEEMFWRCWGMAGKTEFSGNRPRCYDFRHTFATSCLYRWMREGKDLTACLPYLSAYLGHVQLSDTAYYIHLAPEFFPQMAQMNCEKIESLLPEANS